jgi:predicted component of type VI protein secretion system
VSTIESLSSASLDLSEEETIEINKKSVGGRLRRICSSISLKRRNTVATDDNPFKQSRGDKIEKRQSVAGRVLSMFRRRSSMMIRVKKAADLSGKEEGEEEREDETKEGDVMDFDDWLSAMEVSMCVCVCELMIDCRICLLI